VRVQFALYLSWALELRFGMSGNRNLRADRHPPVHSDYEQYRTIWMDGRPHPPSTRNTPGWFFTGKWEGDILTVYTTQSNRAGCGATVYRRATSHFD